MPERRSDKSKYESRYGGGWISISQWLAEYICERQAIRTGGSLTVRFWKLPVWEVEFIKQIALANRLLKKYEPAAISRALQSQQGKTVMSLGAPWLEQAVKQEQAKIDRQRLNPDTTPETPPPATTEAVRPAFVEKPSLRNKLKGL